jgi:hypothetical protein
MRTTLVWLALGALALPAAADVRKDDLKKLAAAGISDEVILAFIRANQPVSRFNADDLVELKQAGVGDRVLALLAGEPAPVVERRVVVPQETYAVEPAVEVAYSPLYLYASTYSSYDGWWAPRFSFSYYGGSGGSCYPRSGSYTTACGPRPYRPVSCPPGSGWSTPPSSGGSPSPGGHAGGGRPGHGWTTPPGHGATPPGRGGTPPGQGSGSTVPGHIGNPGHGGVKPPGPGQQGGGRGNSGRR